jgi:hypothetical protein
MSLLSFPPLFLLISYTFLPKIEWPATERQSVSDSTRLGRRWRFYIVDFIVKYTFIGLYTLNYIFTYDLVHSYSDIIKRTRLLQGFYALSRAPLMIGRIPKEVRNALRKCTVPRRPGVTWNCPTPCKSRASLSLLTMSHCWCHKVCT